MLRLMLSRFRGGLLNLYCNEGRYNGIPFLERIYPLRNGDIETEYPLSLVCKNLAHIRSKYISSIWYIYPTVQKFIQLCTIKMRALLILCLTIYFPQ